MIGYFLMMDDMSPDGLWDCDEQSREDRHYGGHEQRTLKNLQSYRRNHRMWPIGADLQRKRKRMAQTNWIAAGDGSWPEMDHGQ